MAQFDYVILAIIAFSGVLGFARGFIHEAFSLMAYVIAGFAAVMWAPRVYPWFFNLIDHHLISLAISYAVVFIAVLLVVGLVNVSLVSFIHVTGLGPADRGLGLIFGLARGLLLVLILVTVIGYTTFIQELWWQESRFAPMAVNVLLQLKSSLPAELGKYLPY